MGTRVSWLVVAVVAVVSGFSTSSRANALIEVTLDHETGHQNPAGTISVREGEVIRLLVINTSRTCFSFNLAEEKAESTEVQSAADNFVDEIPLEVSHREEVVAYEVEVKKKPGVGTDCDQRLDRTFRIPVRTYGWALAFSGAFTYDELTDPVLSLDAGVENPEAPQEMQRQGFFVRESPGDEDDFTLGAAAMIHLYHNDPDRLSLFFPDKWQVNWAPISFGLGVSNSSETRYFAGTTLRFGKQLYLSLGGVFGSVERLPNGLALDGFTTDANALKNLSSKTDSAIFLSLSYSFLDTGLASFQNAFKEVKPAPSTAKEEKPSESSANTELAARITEALNQPGAFDNTTGFNALFKSGVKRFCAVKAASRPDKKVNVTVSVSADSLANAQLLQQSDDAAKAGYKVLADALNTKVTELLKASNKELGEPITLNACP